MIPPDLNPAVQAWWVSTLKQVVETPEWQAYLVKNGIFGNPTRGDESTTYLEETSAQYRVTLVETGAIQE
ncbi:MAG: hypothetical protein AAF141_13950 [Pseudomonadota bacterium]